MTKQLYLLLFVLFITAGASKAQQSLVDQYHERISNFLKKPADDPKAPTVDRLMKVARSLIGIPYRYASGNPERGFDCSGFVNYVFRQVGQNVPRSSPEFTRTGKPVKLENTRVGDVLIFTGSNPRVRKVGHVGIVYAVGTDGIKFIHSTSGKANGVTISAMDNYYKSRFLKAVTIVE